ncbi:GNAT family N-acetyltransferase [Nibribacter koreensis]
MTILETNRLTLHHLSLDDAPFMVELLNDPAWLQYIGDRNVKTLDQARFYLENGPLKSYRDLGFGPYLVRLKENNMPIGTCGLLKRDVLPAPDIGYAFMPDHRGKGYALEAAQGTLLYGRETLGMHTVYAYTTPNNEKSGKLLEKLGFTFERIFHWPETAEALKLYKSTTSA